MLDNFKSPYLGKFYLSLAAALWAGCILPSQYWRLAGIAGGFALLLAGVNWARRPRENTKKVVSDEASEKLNWGQIWVAGLLLLGFFASGVGLQWMQEISSLSVWKIKPQQVEIRVLTHPQKNAWQPRIQQAEGVIIGAGNASVPRLLVSLQCSFCHLKLGELVRARVRWQKQTEMGKPKLRALLQQPVTDEGRPWLLSIVSPLRESLAKAVGVSRGTKVTQKNTESEGSEKGVRAPPDAAILLAMTVGDKSALDKATTELLRKANLSHLTAVSGTHVLCVAWFVFVVLSLFSRVDTVQRRRLRIVISGLAILAYAVVVGPSPSVLRAVLMSTLAMMGLLSGYGRNLLATLAVSVCLILFIFPYLAVSLGFQLSVLATIGLASYGTRVSRACKSCFSHLWPWRQGKGIAMWMGGNLGISAVASVAVFPLIAPLRGGYNPWGILANILVVPLVAPVVCGGLLVALCQLLWPALAHFLLPVLLMLTHYILVVAGWVSCLPGSDLPWPEGSAGQVLGFASVAVLLLQFPRVSEVFNLALKRGDSV